MDKLFNSSGDTKWILVKSSNLFAIKYNINDRILQVQFGNPEPKSQYAYKNVNLAMFTALIQSPSHGKYFSAHIRKNPQNYPYKMVELENIDIFNSQWKPGQSTDYKNKVGL